MKKNFDKNIGNGNYLFLAVYPLLGVGKNYFKLPDLENEKYYPTTKHVEEELQHREERFKNEICQSDYIDDIIITNHPRFETLSSYCRKKTGKKQQVLIPIYNDINTKESVKDEKYEDFIHNDAFGAGMGNGCLQFTVGMETLNSCLYVYDQLIQIMPLITALSAQSPFFKGKLSKHDVRLSIINQGCDERFEEEKDPKNENYIFDSRFSFIYSYLSDNQYSLDSFNNLPEMPINKDYYKKLKDKKFSDKLATHFCNLLVRDPQVIFSEKVKIDDPEDNSHFLNFQSTNWNSLRLKPTVNEDGDNLFKIEIRPCDIQINEFENAAMITFVILYIEMIKKYDINFIIPLHLAEKNYDNSLLMDAASKTQFHWRTNSITEKNYKESNWEKYDYLQNSNKMSNSYIEEKTKECCELNNLDNVKLLSLSEILEGKNSCEKNTNTIFQHSHQNINNDICNNLLHQCVENNKIWFCPDCMPCKMSECSTTHSVGDQFCELDELIENEQIKNKIEYKGLLPIMIEYANEKYKNDSIGLEIILNQLEFIKLRAQGNF